MHKTYNMLILVTKCQYFWWEKARGIQPANIINSLCVDDGGLRVGVAILNKHGHSHPANTKIF
jgi:hypothetical protein